MFLEKENTTNNLDSEISKRPPMPPKVNMGDGKKKKPLKIRIRNLLIIIASIIIIFLIGVNLAFRLPVKNYYEISKREFRFPDIYSDFIPQGIYYGAESGDIYLTGYMTDETAAPLYIIDKESKKIRKKVRFLNMDGSEHAKHTSGICVYNGDVYITSVDDKLYVFDLIDIHNAKDDEGVRCKAEVSLNNAGDSVLASTVTVHDGNIVVSEFYKKGTYDTEESHKVETKDGDNNAYAIEFNIDNNYNATPLKVYSIPAKAQGLCFDENNLYISESYGLSFSNIECFDYNKLTKAGKRTVLGKEVDMYIADSESLNFSLKLSPMSEEIEIIDGKMYVVCESASSKYIFGRLYGATRCYAIDMNKLKEKML